MIIVLNGVPGSGKTTLAINLAKKLEIEQVIQTDTIKEIFHIKDYPELSYIATHSAWKFFGLKNISNIIKGFIYHTKYFENTLLKLIELTQKKGKNIIVEGVQITPEIYSKINTKDKIGFFLTTDKEERLRRFDLKNNKRSKKNNGWYENFDAIIVINQYLRNEAIKNNMIILENYDIESSINAIEKEISRKFNTNTNELIIKAK